MKTVEELVSSRGCEELSGKDKKNTVHVKERLKYSVCSPCLSGVMSGFHTFATVWSIFS